LDDVSAFWISSFFFVALVLLIVVTWAMLDIVRGCRKLSRYCLSVRTQRIHKKREKQKDIEMAIKKKEEYVGDNKSAEVVKSEHVASEVSEVTVQ